RAMWRRSTERAGIEGRYCFQPGSRADHFVTICNRDATMRHSRRCGARDNQWKFSQQRRKFFAGLLALLVALAAELLELGEGGTHIQLARFFLGLGSGGNLRLLARGGLGGR